MKQFKVEHTAITEANPESIWELWADVNNWSDWDAGLENCNFTGEFKSGNTFELKPKGAPNSIKATLQEVVKNERFSDKTDLGFATIEAIHQIDSSENETKLTHTIIANVVNDKAEFFEQNVWPGLQTGLPQSVENLARLAEK